MGRIDRYDPGSFCWAELATSDTEQAKHFYASMFDWTVVEHPVPGGVYIIFQSDGNDAAAMHVTQPGVPPHWGVYFSVRDVDESAARITPLGGKVITGPFDVMDAGRMAVAQDPQGAVFSLWQAKLHIGATHGGPLNQVCWPELATSDAAGAVEFYTGVLGWKTTPKTGFEAAQYVEWINGESHMGGLLPMRGPQWKGVPPHWMIYIRVADCNERAAKAKELGATICVPPTDIPNVGRFSVIRDPQGVTFSLIQMTAMRNPATV